MSKRTLIGLMFCTLFLSAPAFAQQSTAQPVIQTAQAVQNDVTIPAGATQEFDAAKGEIKFDGTLTNKGTIIIKSSNPAQVEAVLSAAKFVNEGRIVSEVPSLTINASILGGTGDYNAPETINVRGTDRLEIRGGRFYSEWFRPKTKGWLIINANRIDGKVELEAEHLSMGVREGNLNVVKQKLDGDPLIYNTGGDVISPIAPSGGHDILVIASGNVTLNSGIDATGSATNTEGKIAIGTGGHFVRNSNGEVIEPCGISNGIGNDCNNLAQSLSFPGGPLEVVVGDFPITGKITITGEVKAKSIIMTSREIEINGNLHAVKDGDPAQAAISLFATKSITVTGTIKADSNSENPYYGLVSLEAPTITVGGKITTDSVDLNAYETAEATTGSITTAAIEAGAYIGMNGGHIQFAESGGAFTGGAPLPLSQPHDSGAFTIKTGKLTAHQSVFLAATGNIDAGSIELLPFEAAVPLAEHNVRIHANVGNEDASVLKIGGGTNGAASITVHGTTDLGPGLTQKTGAIFLTNGPSGDIVVDGANLHITNEHNGTPSLIVSAGTGQVTVKGNIVFDGTSTAPAGRILLVGDEIRSTGATISAKDTLPTAADNPAKVVFATSKLTLAGDITVEANSKAQTSVRVVPKGSILIDPQDHISLSVDGFPVNVTDDEVLVAGAANLTVKAKSDQAKVEITAKPLKFNNGTTEIFATGQESQINIDYPGAPTGDNSLVFSGGAVTIDASNQTNAAGTVSIKADKVKNDTTVTLKADATANGDGGRVDVLLDRGSISLGSTATGFKMSATSNTGKGGNVSINNHQHNGTVVLQNSFDSSVVNVASTNGDGGTIEIWADHLTNNASSGSGSFIANGAKDAGTIDIKIRDAIVVSSESPGVQLTAISTQSGNGGKVHVTSTNSSVSIEGVNINVQAAGNGRGGVIDIKAKTDLTINGDLWAKGAGNRQGGRITVDGQLVNLEAIGFDVSGGLSNGKGGEITITSASSFAFGREDARAQLIALGSGTGSGGTITVNSPGDVDVRFLTILAKGGATGEGGTVTLPKAINVIGMIPVHFNIESGKQHDPTVNDGTVTIAGVTCHQRQSINPWPEHWFDCVNSMEAGNVPDGAFLVYLGHSNFATLLKDNKVVVAAMNNVNDWWTFFDLPPSSPNGIAGISANRTEDPPFHGSTWLATVINSGGSGTNPESTFHVISHELGHDLDSLFGKPSAGAAWLAAYSADATGPTSDLNTMLSDPNNPNSPRVPRPCTSLYSQTTCNAHSGKTNWEIYATMHPSLSSTEELFCEMFARRFAPAVNTEVAAAQNLMTYTDAFMQTMIANGQP